MSEILSRGERRTSRSGRLTSYFLTFVVLLRFLRVVFLLILLLTFLLVTINGVLCLRPLQLDGDIRDRPGDIIVVPERLEARNQHLNSQLAIGSAVEAGFTFRIGLELQAAALLLAMLVHRMQYHAGVTHRFAVSLPHH